MRNTTPISALAPNATASDSTASLVGGDQRRAVVESMLANEDDYLDSIGSMIKGYFDPLSERAAVDASLLSLQDIEDIFRSVQPIYERQASAEASQRAADRRVCSFVRLFLLFVCSSVRLFVCSCSHRQLKLQLAQRLRQWSASSEVGDILCELPELFEPYKEYIVNFPMAGDVLAARSEEPGGGAPRRALLHRIAAPHCCVAAQRLCV